MHASLKEWQQNNKMQLQSPTIAWPTVCLFLLATGIFITSSYAALTGHLSLIAAFFINACMQFALFTVLHDASHRSLSQVSWLNELLGSISVFILTPLAGIKVFRFIHMQHHRFTNEDVEHDPDYWASKGHKWLRPLRWMFLDIHYIHWYLKHWNNRPRRERIELIACIVAAIIIFFAAYYFGYALWVLLLWFVPGRVASSALVMAFDYLPHYPHDTTAKENAFRATNLKPNASWLMTPILLGQNYHLIHHLYPRIPFYRYAWVWKSAQQPLIDSGARLMRWNGKEIRYDTPNQPNSDTAVNHLH